MKMSTYRLAQLFEPRSVALVGASPKEHSLGRKVLANVRSGAFAGPIFLVNPKYPEIDGIASVAHLRALPSPPDLIVITAPASEVPSIIESAGTVGCSAAVIISAGLGHGPGSLAEQCRSIADDHGLRIVGPNGIGMLAPSCRSQCQLYRQSRSGGRPCPDLAVRRHRCRNDRMG
jgi:acetyltransferase